MENLGSEWVKHLSVTFKPTVRMWMPPAELCRNQSSQKKTHQENSERPALPSFSVKNSIICLAFRKTLSKLEIFESSPELLNIC